MDEGEDQGDGGMGKKIGDATVLDASSRRIVELKMENELCHLAFPVPQQSSCCGVLVL